MELVSGTCTLCEKTAKVFVENNAEKIISLICDVLNREENEEEVCVEHS